MREILWAALVVLAALVGGVGWYALRGWGHLGTPTERATYETLHTASLAAPALRAGLTEHSAERAAPYLRRLLATNGVVLADPSGVLAAECVDNAHQEMLAGPLAAVLARGRPVTLSPGELQCAGAATCALQGGVVVPILVDGAVVGAIAAVGPVPSAGTIRVVGEVAQFVSTQLELAELDRSRRRAVQAELSFLRAQISPHFLYNALGAIESFIRTDPERARDLLIGFADFTRYTFRNHDQFVTVAEEIRLVETYLDLERARFGDRLAVTLRVSPEVLPVEIPSLILQPLVENAVRHGIEPNEGPGRLSILISDAGSEAMILVEDDGAGADPAYMRRVLAGTARGGSVGLNNVDERLRTVFGEEYGLTLETAPGAGMTVTLRIPKFRARVGVP
ncbi:MAG TPA: histidine kinase [Acidimicrobiales bacterium]|nr:histidine kinase [Acidimicrobiales bacterium]